MKSDPFVRMVGGRKVYKVEATLNDPVRVELRNKLHLPEGAITSRDLLPHPDPEVDAFMRRIYDGQVAHKVKKGKKYFPDLSESDLRKLVCVAPRKFLLDYVAHDFLRMQEDAARAIGATFQGPLGHPNPVPGPEQDEMGVVSAHRTLIEDRDAWRGAFLTNLKRTNDERRRSVGGPYGHKSYALLLALMNKRKAPPGFSNHSKGIAVDLTATQYFETCEVMEMDPVSRKMRKTIALRRRLTVGASATDALVWRQTKLHVWLAENHRVYNFMPLSTEEWHWDHPSGSSND